VPAPGSRSRRSTAPTSGSATVASSLIVIIGDEEFLVDRAVRRLIDETVGSDRASADVLQVEAAELDGGRLATLVAPSLFADQRVVVLRNADALSKESADELLSLCRRAVDDPTLHVILTHRGKTNRGKTVLEDVLGLGARRIDCPRLTRTGERIDFVRGEFAAQGRSISEDTARALVDAIGADVAELAAACAQLAADTTGRITADVVRRYFRGRADASGFAVADAILDGERSVALEQLRWALATGTAPVLIVGAVAQGLRVLARVGSAGRGRRPADVARELGLPPWRVDRARAQLRHWTPTAVAAAIVATGAADLAVKGGGVNPAFALEKMIEDIDRARVTR
jgi:DNA polymerase-3 subunit delta